MDSNFKQFLVTVKTVSKTNKDCDECIFFDDKHNANFDCGDLCPGSYKIWVFKNRKLVATTCKYIDSLCPGKEYVSICDSTCKSFDVKLILNER